MIEQSRRQYTRKTLNPLPYISLPSGNGGLVLDISEQGLCFRAIAPVERSGPIPFSFKSDLNLIAGTGELVWFDPLKKTGGLKFTQLPYEALEQIRKWPENSNLRPDISKDLTLHIPAPEEPRSAITDVRRALAAFRSKFASTLDALPHQAVKSKGRENWLPRLGNALTLTKLRALVPKADLREHPRWLFKTAYALLLGVVVSTFVYVRHREAGELLIRLGTKLAGEVGTVTAASTVNSSGNSSGPRADDSSLSGPKGATPVARAAPQPGSAATPELAEQISAGTNTPQTQEATARAPKPESNGVKLVVQVAALKAETDARELTNTLRHENFEAFVGTLPVDSLYRVMLGPYADQASARTVLAKLKRAGFNSFIRRDSGAERLGS